MQSGPLEVERTVDPQAGLLTLTLRGPLTLATVFDLQDAIRLDPQPKTIIHLGAVPYMDSAGLGALLSFHASCQRTGRRYVLAAISPRVMAMFVAAKVHTLVNIEASSSDALKSLE